MKYFVSNQTYIEDKLYSFQIISLEESIKLLEGLKEVGLDTETSGLSCISDKILLLQLGNEEIQIIYHIETWGEIPKLLKEYLSSDRLFILQNAKFDLKFLMSYKVYIKNVYDTFLAERIITNGNQYSGFGLNALVSKYCGHINMDKSVREDIVKRFSLSESILEYSALDVVPLSEIKRKQLATVKAGNLEVVLKIENAFVKCLAYMEVCGIKLDWDKWVERDKRNKEKVMDCKKKLEQWLYDNGYTKYFSTQLSLFDEELVCNLNWNSSAQVKVLFKEIGINVSFKKKGETKESIDEKSLASQINDFPILPLYFDYKGNVKQSTTYGLSWANYIEKKTGRIHTVFHQLKAETGRLSCGINKGDEKLPNLQNLPNDAFTRSCFVAEPGNKICATDYCGQEQIILANFSKEPNLLKFYEEYGALGDMHTYVASLMFPELSGMPLDVIKKEHKSKRSIAKSCGFAINYGGNGSTIARNCNMTKEKGDEVYENYFKAFPKLREHFDNIFVKATSCGYIEFNSVCKRKFFIGGHPYFEARKTIEEFSQYMTKGELYNCTRDLEKHKAELERMCKNYCIQGSAASISKLAGAITYAKFIEREWIGIVKIINMVHDEFLIEAPEHLIEEAKDVLEQSMKEAGMFYCSLVPLEVDSAIGDFWIH